MSQDPNDLSQGLAGQTDPPAGSPPADLAEQVEKLKAENAQMRAERRFDRTKALVEQNGLSATDALELARLGSLEEIEARVAQIVAARPPTATPPATPPVPPSSEPADVAALRAMSGGHEGGDPPLPTPSLTERMNAEINQAKSLREVEEIQRRYRVLEEAQGS